MRREKFTGIKNISPVNGKNIWNIKFFGNNIVSAGIKFGNFKAKGFSLIFSYFSGKSIHGQYFDISENYSTLGFNMDL